MKRLLFVMLLFVSLCDISAQTTISGNVRNEKGENVFNVVVVIKNINDNLIVGYSSTDENGLFSITYDSNDSLLALNVQGFNIKKEICKIENKSQHIDIVIKEEPIVLQEVSVKSEKVWENNDTISYLADAFRDTTDIVIADVLKKMPGIEVKDDGKIEYKGKAISKFYIEDMDMLQGRYNIATNNIPASDVHLVQVMENHQEVKALKNIDFTDAVALNIKLKAEAKGTLVLMNELGVGYDEDMLWDVNIAGMRFGKKMQFISTIQTNNNGSNLSNKSNGGSGKLASTIKPSVPNIGDSRTTFNDSYGLTFNSLQKLNNDAELSLNILGGFDKNRKSSFARTSYLVPEIDSISIYETMNYGEKSYSLETDINYNLNTKLDYLKINFNVLGNDILNSSDIESSSLIRQKEDYQNLTAKAYIRWIRKSRTDNEKGIEINSRNTYNILPYYSDVSPGSFPEELNNGINYDMTKQNVDFTSFKSNNTFRFLTLFVIKRISIHPYAIVNVERQTLNSSILCFNDNQNVTDYNDNFNNDLVWLKTEGNIGFRFDYRKRRFTSELTLPVQIRHIDLDDNINENSKAETKVLFQPDVNLKYKLNNSLDVSATSRVYNTTPTLNTQYSSYILRNYRTLTRYDSNLSDTKGNTSSLKLSFNDVMNFIFGDISMNYNYQVNEVMYSQTFEDNYIIINTIDKRSYGDYLSFSLYLGKGFNWKRLNINGKCSYGFGKSPQLVQDNIATYNNQGWNANVTASMNITNAVIFSNKFSWSDMKSSIEGQTEPDDNILSFVENANIDFVLPFGFVFGSSFEYYFTSDNYGKQHFMLWDCNLTYTYKNLKFNMECNNILNTESFVYSYFTDIYNFYSSYHICPRSVMLKLKFEI